MRPRRASGTPPAAAAARVVPPRLLPRRARYPDPAPAPDMMLFGALGDLFVAQLAEARGMVLSDDYAPIDRLMGRRD